MDSKALTKTQSVALIAIVVVAAVGGSVAYVLWSANQPPMEDIRIGVCADLDMPEGKAILQAIMLATEQVNAHGGILGRNFTVVAEDDDDETLPTDIAVLSNAMTKLITIDKADYIVSAAGGGSALIQQDICAEHGKIMFGTRVAIDNVTQRVKDDYERYKYYFKFYGPNATTVARGTVGDILTVGNYTGFTKIALLGHDSPTTRTIFAGLNSSLPTHGFEIVYSQLIPYTVTDFSSYFAAIEASGAEILYPLTYTQVSVPLVKEWHDRQSPFVVWGGLYYSADSSFWELTEGKCEYISIQSVPVLAGYPLTNKTVPTREAYLERWGAEPTQYAIGAYDGVRFILTDAIRRAGTTEAEAVIKALESTDVETSLARHFIFTSSHDLMFGTGELNSPVEDYVVICYFQWQANATRVPVRPEAIMKEAGATYKYPAWSGPWDQKQTP